MMYSLLKQIQKLTTILIVIALNIFAYGSVPKVDSQISICNTAIPFELIILEDYNEDLAKGIDKSNHSLTFCVNGIDRATSKIILGPKQNNSKCNGSFKSTMKPGECKKITEKDTPNLQLVLNTENTSTVKGKYILCYKDVGVDIKTELNPYCFHDSNDANGPSHGCIRVLNGMLNNTIIPAIGSENNIKIFRNTVKITFTAKQKTQTQPSPTQQSKPTTTTPSRINVATNPLSPPSNFAKTTKPKPSDYKERNESCSILKANLKKIKEAREKNPSSYSLEQYTSRDYQLNYGKCTP